MNIEVKKVRIGSFKNIQETGIIQSGFVICNVERQDTYDKICIIDGDYAIDINDFKNKYPIIKRNEYNQILPEQEIIEDVLYALDIQNLDKNDDIKSIKQKKKIHNYLKKQSKNK